MGPMSVTRRLGRYRIGERIGTGGVADVYRAEVEGAAGFAKTLVVKCLRPHVADEPELVEGLAREAKLAQRLQHGNIVQVFDFGSQDGQPYVVMEHVDGCSLHELTRDLHRRGERMGLPEALFVIEELAAALRYAHALTDDDGAPLSIVHRDVKPRNVLVSRDGVVKLTDFGIAKVADDHAHTLPGVIKGTPAYLSPEQARGRPVDARTDLFALGLVLGELVLDDEHTGDAPAVDPRVDDELRRLIERATADDPDERFADADALLRSLQRWRAAREIDASPGRLATWVRRARKQPPKLAPVSLDAALLGGSERDATDPATAHATTTAVPEPTGGLHRGFLALAVAFAVGGVVWAATSRSEAPAPTTSSTVAPTAAPAARGPDHDAPPEQTKSPEQVPHEAAPAPVEEPPPEPPSIVTEPPEQDATPDDADARPSGPRRSADVPRRRVDAEPGRIQVNVLPWAEVRIDGRDHGRVPVDVELPPGRYRVELRNPQLGSVTKEVQLRSGVLHKIKEW